jgi:mono/diheme cytochrome c family protein
MSACFFAFALLADVALPSDLQPALPPPATKQVEFARDIQPIFARACYACHGPTKQRSGFRLDRKAAALKGGDLGRAIIPGKSADSPLIRYIAGLDRQIAMPPKKEDRLSKKEIGLLRAWIDQGALWPESAGADDDPLNWWSLRSLSRPALPKLWEDDSCHVRNAVDAFVWAKLREKGLRPSPSADRRTLIRRLSFDLLGLPPTPEEVAAFVADPAADAYENLVDRLLASPHYGERWARHWLDVVHYGETHGYDKDKPRLHAWPYRDYVIRAFNADKSYARFVQEQIAGDVLFPGTRDGIEALGFLAAGPWDFIGHAEVPETKIDGKIARHLDRDDMVTNTIQTFNSLTIQCAQCHDHKFDPIPQEDYYSLQAVFAAIDRTDRHYDLDPSLTRKRDALEAERMRLTNLKASLAKKQDRLEDMAHLANIEKELTATNSQLAALPPPLFVYSGAVHNGVGPFRGTGSDRGKPRPIYILTRGSVLKPGKEVGPGALQAVRPLEAHFILPASHAERDRRAALARWVTDVRHPLTWRSIANRVWHYHFGRGLVETANDFGRNGQLPTHPELLDWLACEFRDSGQSLKQLHRLIVCSATYRQSSANDAASATIDANNRYLWRMNRRRLEAEAVRDSVLALSGKLNCAMYGPSFQDFVIDKPEHSPHYEYALYDPEDSKSHRRAVYRFIVRSQQQPFMTTLDCADPSMQVDRRNESLSALQALAMLNNDFMIAMARHFAEKLKRMDGDLAAKIERGYLECMGVPASHAEMESLLSYGQRRGLTNVCRLLFNMNGFVFID